MNNTLTMSGLSKDKNAIAAGTYITEMIRDCFKHHFQAAIGDAYSNAMLLQREEFNASSLGASLMAYYNDGINKVSDIWVVLKENAKQDIKNNISDFESMIKGLSMLLDEVKYDAREAANFFIVDNRDELERLVSKYNKISKVYPN